MHRLALVAALAVAPMWSAGLAAQVRTDTAARATRDTLAAVRDSSFRDSIEVNAVARRYAATVRTCYQEQGLKADPSLRGLLRVELTVLPAGSVHAASTTATEVNGAGMPAVTSCISTAARAWRFSDGAPAAERVVLEFDLLPPTR